MSILFRFYYSVLTMNEFCNIYILTFLKRKRKMIINKKMTMIPMKYLSNVDKLIEEKKFNLKQKYHHNTVRDTSIFC